MHTSPAASTTAPSARSGRSRVRASFNSARKRAVNAASSAASLIELVAKVLQPHVQRVERLLGLTVLSQQMGDELLRHRVRGRPLHADDVTTDRDRAANANPGFNHLR